MEFNLKQRQCFVIAEAGSNWRAGSPEADWKRAIKLIGVAKTAGADAIKFQVFRGKTVYVPNAGASDYLAEAGIKKPIQEIFKDLEMPYEMIPKLAKHCRKIGIEFMASVFSVEDAKVVDPHVKRHKIASYEITHADLLAFVAKTKKPVILSTGAADLDQVTWAVKWFYKNGGRNLSLMQCTAKYPAEISSLNLRVIPALAKKFKIPVGLSDHSMDPIVGPIAAVAQGARIIEKHFTLDRELKGPDHAFALEPDELKLTIKSIRDCERALGSTKKIVRESEKELYNYAQRGIQAIRDIRTGDIFKLGYNISILRPGKQHKGIHPKNLQELEGKRAKRNIFLGDGIKMSDY